MNIAIIDDSVEEARQLSGYVQTYFHSVHILQRTELFTAAADFLQVWKKDSYQLVFIDIYLGQETLGLGIAEQIRREDKSCVIIFTTSSSGTLQKADDDTDIGGYVNDPVEPVWDED